MESLVLLAVLVFLALPVVALLHSLLATRRLKDRTQRIESRLDGLVQMVDKIARAGAAAAPPATRPPPPAAPPPHPAPPPLPRVPASPISPSPLPGLRRSLRRAPSAREPIWNRRSGPAG